MILRSYLLSGVLTSILFTTSPASALQTKLDDCLKAPVSGCEDVIIESLLSDLAVRPEIASESDHVTRIANMLSQTPRLAQAEQLAAALPDDQRGAVIERIAVRHAIMGQFDEARRLMKALDDARSSDTVRLEIVRTAMGNGDEAAAQAALQAMKTPAIRDGALAAMAETLLRQNNRNRMIDLATQIDDPTMKVIILGRVLSGNPGPELIEQTVDAMGRVAEPIDRIRGYSQLAVALASQKNTDKAIALFQRAKADLDRSDIDAKWRRRVQNELNSRLAEAGQFELALKGIAQMEDVKARINLLTFIASRCKRQGDVAKAEELFRESLSLARGIDDAERRDKELGFIVARLSKTKIPLRDQAHQIAASIEDRKRRGETLRVLATHYSIGERYEQAERLLRSIDDPAMRVQGLMNLAWTLGQKDSDARANAIFDEVVNVASVAGAFEAMADRTRDEILNTAVKLGAFEPGMRLAQRIESLDQRIIALTDLALGMIEAGQSEAGRALLHETIREADKVDDDGVRRSDLVYRLSFRTHAIGGLEDVSAVIELINAPDIRQLFLYEVARNWLNDERHRTDARTLVDRFGSDQVKRAFRERLIEITLMRAVWHKDAPQ
ncbi:MAG: hypothetical protein AAGL24_16020 [Pseudomonadota bacterium]